MPIKLNSTGGGAVSIDVPSTASTFNLTLPATNGSIVTSGDSNTVNSNVLASNSVTAAKLTSGMIVKTTSYTSGYGSGARLTTNSASWYALNINGTGRDTYGPNDNLNIRYFDKVRSDTHLRIRTALPLYITPGGAGVGLRVQMVLSSNSTLYNDGNQYFTVGLLSSGQAERWGAIGYGGDNAGIINAYYDTQYSTSSSSVLAYSGRLHYYFMGFTWATSDTAYWIDYDNTYPKYGTWTVEEYIP
jgi:hypothetical protein